MSEDTTELGSIESGSTEFKNLERDLLLELKAAKARLITLQAETFLAQNAYDAAVNSLSDHLILHGASATRQYNGVWAKLNPPLLIPSYPPSEEASVFEWLRANGEGSAIKLSVHWKVLGQIIGDRLKEGEDMPPAVTYYLKPKITLFGGKNGE